MGIIRCPCVRKIVLRLHFRTDMAPTSSWWCHLGCPQHQQLFSVLWIKCFLSCWTLVLCATRMTFWFIPRLLSNIRSCLTVCLGYFHATNCFWKIPSVTSSWKGWTSLDTLFHQKVFLLNKIKCRQSRTGLHPRLSTKFNSFLVWQIIIGALYCAFLRLQARWVSLHTRVYPLCGELSSSVLLMFWSSVCALHLFFLCLTSHVRLVSYVMPPTFALALCWSSKIVLIVSGTLWSTTPNVSVHLSVIIVPRTATLSRLGSRLSAGATFWSVHVFWFWLIMQLWPTYKRLLVLTYVMHFGWTFLVSFLLKLHT